MNAATGWWTMLVIGGLTVVTVVARCFFFIFDRPWTLPAWANRALQYAPGAALAGVIAPEIVMSGGQLAATWHDARIFAAPVAALLFYWRRSVLLTIVGGMAVYLPLHVAWGW